MKYKVLSLMLLVTALSFGQTKRNGISYQAMILNTKSTELPGVDLSNNPLANTNVCLKFEIIDHTNAIEYSEELKTSTDPFGMVNVVIGTGVPTGFNNFENINWSAESKEIKVYADISGNCLSFKLIGTQALTSVPFALYSPASDIPGPQGDSAYKVWLEEGNEGDKQAFFNSLAGAQGKSAFNVWQDQGNEGDEQTFLNSIKGPQGDSAYKVWLDQGNEGTEEDFINSLRGPMGPSGSGDSAYEIWLSLGNEGTEQDFINSLKGANGADGTGGGALLDLPDGEVDGDILQWVWNTDKWVYVIVKPDDSGIILTSGAGSRNQTVCELKPINTITYAFTGTVSNVVVTGLPTGVSYQVADNILNISGTPSIDVGEQSTYQYVISLSNGTKTINATGNIIINPQATISLKTGDLTQSSCLGQPINPIEFSIDNPSPNVEATGLPDGITAVVTGDIVTLQGTPSVGITNGSVFNYTLSTQSTSCDVAQISGSMSFADCTNCIPLGSAGSDATICNGDTYTLTGSASNYTDILWTTSGTGTFNNPNTTNPIYTPTIADFNSGGVTLSLTISNTSCTTSQTIVDSMALDITNCSSITLELQNNDEAYLFAYDLTFGAKVVTDNMQKVANVGLCYNTTGGPTVNDSKVSQNYINSGFWISDEKTFTMNLSGVPVSKIYVRAFATSIGGDVFYGDQIEVDNYDPNRNQIYNFTETSGDFSPNNYTINTSSDIHFVNITTLNKINWDYGSSVPNYSNILAVNFPNLEKVNRNIRVINEKSLVAFNAPKLKEVGEGIQFNATSLKDIYLPELVLTNQSFKRSSDNFNESRQENNFILNNNLLENINLSKLEKYSTSFYIHSNPKITRLNFSSLQNSVGSLNHKNLLRIYNNDLLDEIIFGSIDLEFRVEIDNNPALTNIEFPNAGVMTNSGIEINDNAILTSVQIPNATEITTLSIYSNPELQNLSFPAIEKVHSNLIINNNDKLTSLSAPSLLLTGTNQYLNNSFKIDGNALLDNLDFTNLEKVYGNLQVTNNAQLNLSEFNCPIFIYENDGFDCSFGTLTISGNLDNTYCFQDPSLLTPVSVTTASIVDLTSVQATSGGVITAPSNMISRGCVWSTTQTPTLEDNENFSLNGNMNGTFTSYLYDLQPGTVYYVRGYGVDCNGTHYGDIKTFTTPQ